MCSFWGLLHHLEKILNLTLGNRIFFLSIISKNNESPQHSGPHTHNYSHKKQQQLFHSHLKDAQPQPMRGSRARRKLHCMCSSSALTEIALSESKQHIPFIKKTAIGRLLSDHAMRGKARDKDRKSNRQKYAQGKIQKDTKRHGNLDKKKTTKDQAGDVRPQLERERKPDGDITSSSLLVPLLWFGKHQKPTSHGETPPPTLDLSQ